MTREKDLPSAYDYIIKGKEPPRDVVEATIEREEKRKIGRDGESEDRIEKIKKIMASVAGKSVHEQYLELQRNHIPIPNWPEDNEPSGFVYGEMEGGKPARVD